MSTTPALDRSASTFGARLGRHVIDLVRLAVPVMVARAGMVVMSTVDTLIVGRYGTVDLAYYGLGSNISMVIVAALAGLLLGTVVSAAHALGAGQPEETGAIWRRSLPYALLLGTVAALLCLLAEPFFRLTGQPSDLAEGGGRVMAVTAVGMPAAALYFTTSMFLEGLKRPIPGMVAMIIVNLLNVLFVWALVFGRLGFPALGAEGAAWATAVLRWLIALSLIAYVWWLPERHQLGIRRPTPGWWVRSAKERRLGLAAGVSNGLEASSFGILTLFAGALGALELAAYTVGLNLLALPFMAALGLATATAVRVGVAYGAGDMRDLRLAGWTGLLVTSFLLALVGLGFAAVPDAIARLFASDPALIAVTAPLVAFSAWILVADGGQVVMAQALRGRNDAWAPTALHFGSYYVVMLPLSALLSFGAGRGVQGLFEGILIASVVSVSMLATRFWWLARDR